ncbi:MAG: hypothetical protein AB7V56_16235 [Candidatus Nitrosocosmicus sp.]|jgi:hypothetical protein|nr:hypothetical protein [Candidatus Nitrosocosmicus sp.]
MRALASLSKFLGRYDEWLEIVKRYQLKWSKPDKSVNVFKSIVDSQNQSKDIESMLKWIKKVSAIFYGTIRFNFTAVCSIRNNCQSRRCKKYKRN